jgi:hypothetical protein
MRSAYAAGFLGLSDRAVPRGSKVNHAAVPRQVGELRLPAARVDVRPRRQQ